MKHKNQNRLLTVIGLGIILVMTSTFFSLQTVAQRNLPTPVPRDGARLTQSAATVQAGQEQVRGTAQAAQTQIAATAQAAQTQISSTAQAIPTNVGATADAARTTVNATVEAYSTEVIATVDALRTEVAATLQAVADEFEDALSVIDLVYDAEAGTLTLTTTIDENQINLALTAMLEAAGYGTIDATVDLVNNGIIITLEGVALENGQLATAVMYFELVEMDGSYTLVLTDVTVNGISVPLNQLDEELRAYIETYIEDILNGVTSDFEAYLPEGTFVAEIAVDRILITEDLIAVVLIVTLTTP